MTPDAASSRRQRPTGRGVQFAAMAIRESLRRGLARSSRSARARALSAMPLKSCSPGQGAQAAPVVLGPNGPQHQKARTTGKQRPCALAHTFRPLTRDNKLAVDQVLQGRIHLTTRALGGALPQVR